MPLKQIKKIHLGVSNLSHLL